MASLYDECLEKLGEQARVLTEEETIELFDDLQDSFPFTSYGRIDWESVKLKKPYSLETIVTSLETRVFILWDNAIFPAIESTMSQIINALSSIKKVSFDTWIFLPNGFVIEFYHEGEDNVGYLK